MPVVKLGDTYAFICSRGRSKAKSCHKCFLTSQFQCDFPLNRNKSGEVIRTCDLHLCKNHVRHGLTKGIDFCEEHYPIAKAAYEQRTKNNEK